HHMEVGDFNGDHSPDLLVLHGYSWSVLLGNPDGTFQAARSTGASIPISPFGPSRNSVALADFNRDGNLDAVMLDDYSYLWVLLGRGDGTFVYGAQLRATGDHPLSVSAGDGNGDGNPDIAVSSYTVYLHGPEEGGWQEVFSYEDAWLGNG